MTSNPPATTADTATSTTPATPRSIVESGSGVMAAPVDKTAPNSSDSAAEAARKGDWALPADESTVKPGAKGAQPRKAAEPKKPGASAAKRAAPAVSPVDAKNTPGRSAPARTAAPAKQVGGLDVGAARHRSKAPIAPASLAPGAKRPKKVVAAAVPRPAGELAAADKPSRTKEKLVRDSFTMPKADFALIQLLKERSMGFKRETRKSELLRAGLQALAAMEGAALKSLLDKLPKVKTGRPRKTR